MALESAFQARLIRRLRQDYPGAVILKNDPNYLQGFPDLTILYLDTWGVLETKRSSTASRRPNQEYYVQQLLDMGGYASFIEPDSEEAVLNELQQAFRTHRSSRAIQRK